MLLVFLSSVMSEYQEYVWSYSYEQFESVFVLLGYALLTYYAYLYVDSEYGVKIFMWILAAMAVIVSLLAVFQMAGHDFFATEFGQNLIVGVTTYTFIGSLILCRECLPTLARCCNLLQADDIGIVLFDICYQIEILPFEDIIVAVEVELVVSRQIEQSDKDNNNHCRGTIPTPTHHPIEHYDNIEQIDYRCHQSDSREHSALFWRNILTHYGGDCAENE